MRKVLVLGGGGCFGLNTSQFFLDHGYSVIGVGRAPAKAAPFSLEIFHPNYRYEVIHLVHQFEKFVALLNEEKPDLIVNYCALAEVPLSWKHPELYAETNYLAHVKLAKALSGRDCLFIQVGSSEVYGSNAQAVNEEAPIRCSSPYAVSKAAFDMHLKVLRDFRWILVRPSNAYCPGQLLHRVIPRAVVAGLTGAKMPLNGGGLVRKSYFHATDLSRALWLLALTPGAVHEVYNIGPIEPTAIREVVRAVAAKFDRTLEDFCDITPARAAEDASYFLDSGKIRALGWSPTITLDEGLDDMIAWGRKYASQLAKTSPEYRMAA